jgi:hypothetical protein
MPSAWLIQYIDRASDIFLKQAVQKMVMEATLLPSSGLREHKCNACILNINSKRLCHRRRVLLLGGSMVAIKRREYPLMASSNVTCWITQRYHLLGAIHSGKTEQVRLQNLQKKRKILTGFNDSVVLFTLSALRAYEPWHQGSALPQYGHPAGRNVLCPCLVRNKRYCLTELMLGSMLNITDLLFHFVSFLFVNVKIRQAKGDWFLCKVRMRLKNI